MYMRVAYGIIFVEENVKQRLWNDGQQVADAVDFCEEGHSLVVLSKSVIHTGPAACNASTIGAVRRTRTE